MLCWFTYGVMSNCGYYVHSLNSEPEAIPPVISRNSVLDSNLVGFGRLRGTMCHSMCWGGSMHRSLLCFTFLKLKHPRLQVQKFMSFSQLRPQDSPCDGFLCQERVPLSIISGGCPCAFKRSSSKCSCSSILSIQLFDFCPFIISWELCEAVCLTSRMCWRLRKPSWCAEDSSTSSEKG